MGNQSTHRSNKGKGKIAERIAFDPFLPQEDLINEIIRNTISPNTDEGKTYYVGKIIDIIENDDALLDNRDIFYSQSDNYERIVKASNTNKYNEGRKVLIVHIPSFMTNSAYPPKQALNYHIFNKLRIEYRGKETPKIGDIVKVMFGAANYTDPEIIAVEKADPAYIDRVTTIASEAHKKYENCKVLNLKFPVQIGQNDINFDTTPAGGYKRALEELKKVFNDSYIQGFISTIKTKTSEETEFGKIENIILKLNKIGLNSKVYVDYSKDYNFIEVDNQTNNTYLIRGNDIRISCETPTKNDELRNKFYNYIKTDFDSRLGYLFSYNSQTPNDNTFVVDINLNFLENKDIKTVDDYLRISKVFDQLNYYPISNPASKPTEKEISDSTTKRKEIVDKCDAELAKDKSIYPLVYDGKEFKNKKITSDNEIIKSFYSDLTGDSFTKDYVNPSFFYKLVEFDTSKNFKDFLIKKNSNFYKDTLENKESYNLKQGQNFTSPQKVEDNFLKVSNFLLELKRQIESIEQYGVDSGKVLILPIQVLNIKPKSQSKQNDPNSRHFYGKAFDIRVYIKDPDPKDPNKNIIRQINPEIVALYADLIKTNVPDIFEIGQGMFFDEDQKYNHIEFLEDFKTIGLSKEEYDQKLLFVNINSNDPLSEEIKKNGGANRIKLLKNKIRTNSTYISVATNLIDPRFDVLTR